MFCNHLIVNWLNEAYDIDQAILELLDHYNQSVENEDLKDNIESRILEIENHNEKIRTRLEQMGSEPISSSTHLGNLVRNLYDLENADSSENHLKHSILNYGARYFERAITRAILTMASECEDEKTIDLCKDILSSEEEINEELDQEIVGLTINYINNEMVENEKIDYASEEEN